jgi:hypothetical protein
MLLLFPEASLQQVLLAPHVIGESVWFVFPHGAMPLLAQVIEALLTTIVLEGFIIVIFIVVLVVLFTK